MLLCIEQKKEFTQSSNKEILSNEGCSLWSILVAQTSTVVLDARKLISNLKWKPLYGSQFNFWVLENSLQILWRILLFPQVLYIVLAQKLPNFLISGSPQWSHQQFSCALKQKFHYRNSIFVPIMWCDTKPIGSYIDKISFLLVNRVCDGGENEIMSIPIIQIELTIFDTPLGTHKNLMWFLEIEFSWFYTL